MKQKRINLKRMFSFIHLLNSLSEKKQKRLYFLQLKNTLTFGSTGLINQYCFLSRAIKSYFVVLIVCKAL